jgi:hypothetical protein
MGAQSSWDIDLAVSLVSEMSFFWETKGGRKIYPGSVVFNFE